MAIGGDWLRDASPSIEAVLIEAEYDRERPEPVADVRTRVLGHLLEVLAAEDRELLEATTDGKTLAEVARRQGCTPQGLGKRRDLLLAWVAYCAPVALRIEPVLAGLAERGQPLTRAQALWWLWHTGGRSAQVDALARAHPELDVDRARWVCPVRRCTSRIESHPPLSPRIVELVSIAP
jgi:hypothetical protein